jgi:hypothetical protein
MELILSPGNDGPKKLQAAYQRAAQRASELYIASAFLTAWPIKAHLSKKCHKAYVVVGTDFGATRKQALRDALKWLPPRFKHQMFAVKPSPGRSFHPKLLVWREGAKYYCLVGSPNPTGAAFGGNYEATCQISLTRAQFETAARWVRALTHRDLSDPVDASYISDYVERKLPIKAGSSPARKSRAKRIKVPARLTEELKADLEDRRKQMRAFRVAAPKLKRLIRGCASGVLPATTFYERMTRLWEPGQFQSKVWSVAGKRADWRQACASLQRVLNGAAHAYESELDEAVREEIDLLAKAGSPVRRAWFTEMLCQFLPDHYAVDNSPVRRFLAAKGRRVVAGSEGAKYIDLVRRLRSEQKQSVAKNLGELDILIFRQQTRRRA